MTYRDRKIISHTEVQSRRNMKEFLREIGMDGISYKRFPAFDYGNYFGYRLRKENITIDLTIPGEITARNSGLKIEHRHYEWNNAVKITRTTFEALCRA